MAMDDQIVGVRGGFSSSCPVPSSDARGSMTLLEALVDPRLFGEHFAGPSWLPWRTALRALMGLPIPEAELPLYSEATGRTEPPTAPAREGWFVVGRRGGKSRIAALVAVYLAAFRAYEGVLAPGERGTVMVIASDRRQARTIMRYARALLSVPLLRGLVEREAAESIDLRNRITLEIHTSSYRSVRGYTAVGAVLEEAAFWNQEDSAEPDYEILAALRPALATVPGSLLIGISSPYARRGVLWDAYSKHFGKDGDPVLVWKAPSRVMNATLDESIVARAYEDDPDAAAAEWGAEFRRDVERFVSREAVEACIVPGRHELPRQSARHVAFCDASAGSSDSFTLAVAHREEDRAVLDCIRERRPPFSPDDVVREFAEVLGTFGVYEVTGDRWGGSWVQERFQRHAIRYRVSEKVKFGHLHGVLARDQRRPRRAARSLKAQSAAPRARATHLARRARLDRPCPPCARRRGQRLCRSFGAVCQEAVLPREGGALLSVRSALFGTCSRCGRLHVPRRLTDLHPVCTPCALRAKRLDPKRPSRASRP